MWDWPERVPASTFDDLFKIKGVDYRGEEVKLAQALTWSSMSAAFPKEVGSLELQDFCTGGCRIYVQEFEKFLLPPDMQTAGRTPKIRVADHDWPEVCEGLLKTGIWFIVTSAVFTSCGSSSSSERTFWPYRKMNSNITLNCRD